ncbi:MAG TPA: type II toxin-antitoxin system RelE/ParE family toxin [Candidatus Limnocylindria bacterium]|nr:type II toxin-antitoxin system RelE/ParE family toxin [Candidatus Limnocylindria bacterium]
MKELVWIASSKKDLLKLPDEVIDFMGNGLQLAQGGKKDKHAKPLKGFGGADVLELIDSDISGTYRAVYTVKMKDVIFVLHVFQKKSKHGIETPKPDMDLIKSRLKQAQEIYKERFK